MSSGRLVRITGSVDPRAAAIVVLSIGFVVAVTAATTGVKLSAKPGVTAPTITSGPAASTTATTATLTFTDSPASLTFQCQRDGLGFAACTSPKSYSGLAAGSHAFQVKAISGSEQSLITSYSWTIDLTPPPATTLTSKPAVSSNTANPSFGFANGEADVAYSCKLDAAASFTACGNPQSYSNLAQGNHAFAVQARDAAGNVGPITSYNWSIDTVAPPAPVLTAKPSDPAVGATQTFAWTDTEFGLSFQCAGENGVFAACISPYSYVVDTNNNGQHQFAVRAVDAAGNISASTSYKFKVAKDSSTTGMPFQISGTVSGLVLGVWKPIAVHVVNPNNEPIYLTALTFSVAADSTPAGCLSGTNVEQLQSNISATQRLVIPANSSVDLPTQGVTAPQLRLVDRPVNQDVCKNKTFTIAYTGTANN